MPNYQWIKFGSVPAKDGRIVTSWGRTDLHGILWTEVCWGEGPPSDESKGNNTGKWMPI